jgi:hypothetical protein
VSDFQESAGGSAAPAVEILSSEGGQVQEPVRSRRTGVIAGALTVAVLAAATASWAAYSAFNGSGPQPEEVLPASTIAFAKVDLDPSAGQKIELYKLLQTFHQSSQLKSTDKDFGDWLSRRLVESGNGSVGGSGSSVDAGLDYAKDIKPWLGKRFAVAGVPGTSAGTPVQPLVVLQENDEKAASAALEKVRKSGTGTKLDYAFMDGYVVVSPGSATAAHAAVKAAQSSSLAHAAGFKKDVASLQSDEVVTAWADASALGTIIKKATSGASVLPGGSLGGLVDSSYKGTWVLGLHAADNAIELTVKTRGGTASPATPAVAHLDHVVAGAWGVVAISGLDQRVDALWKNVQQLPGYQDSSSQLADEFGLQLPGDLKTLLGSELELSIGGDLSKEPMMLAASTSKDPGAAKSVLDGLLDHAQAPPGLVAERVKGSDTFYVGSSEAAIDAAGGKGVSATALFDLAVADPKTAEVLGFVDLSHVWSARGADLSAQDKEWEHVAAVGFSGRHSGGDSSYTVRVVLR